MTKESSPFTSFSVDVVEGCKPSALLRGCKASWKSFIIIKLWLHSTVTSCNTSTLIKLFKDCILVKHMDQVIAVESHY